MENTNTGSKSAEHRIKLDLSMPYAIGPTTQQYIGLLEAEEEVINIKKSRLFSLIRYSGPTPTDTQVRAMARRTSRLFSDAQPVISALRAEPISELHNGTALKMAVRFVNLRIQWESLERRYLAACQLRRLQGSLSMVALS